VPDPPFLPGAPVRRRPGGQQTIPRPFVWRLGDDPPWATRNRRFPPSSATVLSTVRSRAPRDLAPPFPGARNAAVLVLLHEGDDGPELLFTRRTMRMRSHRGEISFPGGRMDPGETPVETALREAFEEVDLDPSLVTVHGELDHLSTVVSQSYIVPVVATVDARPELVPHDHEVDRILWVSLAELSRPDTFREERWGLPPFDRRVFFFELDDETIWGATGRMVYQFLRLAHGLTGPEPSAL
jgi:8-oxo-dGTP pyrophosphatase MutT (NUDIX family)